MTTLTPSLPNSATFTSLESHLDQALPWDFGCDPTHPSIAKQKQYQDLAFKSLNLALSIDENSIDLKEKAAAIPHYQSGIQCLITGVSLPLPTDPTDQGLVRAHKLRNKMVTNLQTAQERLTYLTTTLHLNNLSLQAVEARSSEDLTSQQPKSALRRSNTFTKDDKKQSSGSRVNTAPSFSCSLPSAVIGQSSTFLQWIAISKLFETQFQIICAQQLKCTLSNRSM